MAEPQLPEGYILKSNPQIKDVQPPEGYILKSEPYKDPVTAATEKVAPKVGRVAAEAAPFLGSLTPFPVIGTILGTGVKQIAKNTHPELFGEPASSGLDIVGDAAKDLAVNVALPAGLGKAFRLATWTDMVGPKAAAAAKFSSFPSVREGLVKNITERLNKRNFPETGIIEQGAENVASKFDQLQTDVTSGVPGAMTQLSNLYGRNNVAGMLLKMQQEAKTVGGDIVRTQTYKEITNKTLSDVVHVQNAKMTAGPEFTNDLAVNRLLTNASNASDGTINAAQALKELEGKSGEIYSEAMNPASYASLKKSLEKMNELEKQGITDRILSYSKGRLVWSTGSGLLLGSAIGHPALAAIPPATLLTDKVLRTMMKDPQLATLVEKALETPVKSAKAGPIQEALGAVLPRIIQGEIQLSTTPDR